MSAMVANRPQTTAEVKRLLELGRGGVPYLVYRDSVGTQREVVLGPEAERVTIGRHAQCTVALSDDGAVSRLHAELVRLAGAWVVADDGLSRNGTYLNGERVRGRQRLADRDVLACGSTPLLFRDPAAVRSSGTTAVRQPITVADLSPMQRKVLLALCRPAVVSGSGEPPATNREIADELVLSSEGIKTHMRSLFRRFAVGDLPQNRKRARLVQLAIDSGIVGPRDYESFLTRRR